MMTLRRRHFLLGGAVAALPPGAFLAASALDGGQRRAEALDASFSRRYDNPLRLPGQGGWFAPVKASEVRALAAAPMPHRLRGHRDTPLWVYRAEVRGRVVLNPILTARAGDTVDLRFDNLLPQPSVIHWHGLANDERSDGGGAFLAAPGGGHPVRWTVRNAAGLNWYHPHPHGHAGEQLWRGLAGLFLVEDDASDRLARELDVRFGLTDVPLVIQDRTLNRAGEMPYHDAGVERMLKSADNATRMAFEALCSGAPGTPLFHGAYGEDILVNFTRFPVLALPRRWARLRILNGSNARLYRLALLQRGRALEFSLLGVDGNLLPAPQAATEVFLAPAQRVDLAVDLRQAELGDLWLKTLAFDPMHDDGLQLPQTLLRPAVAAASMPAHDHGPRGEGAEEPILRIDVRPADGPAGRLPQRIGPAMPPAVDGAPQRSFRLGHDAQRRWSIDGRVFAGHGQTSFTVPAGAGPAREIWEVDNPASGMPHPMHLHGFDFQVLSRQGSPAQCGPLRVDAQGRLATDLGRADTVLVWPGEKVRFLVDFSTAPAGIQRYMFHCHNLEHADAGMMLAFAVDAGPPD